MPCHNQQYHAICIFPHKDVVEYKIKLFEFYETRKPTVCIIKYTQETNYKNTYMCEIASKNK